MMLIKCGMVKKAENDEISWSQKNGIAFNFNAWLKA